MSHVGVHFDCFSVSTYTSHRWERKDNRVVDKRDDVIMACGYLWLGPNDACKDQHGGAELNLVNELWLPRPRS